MGDYAEETGIGRKGPGTVLNPPKPAQTGFWTEVQNAMVQVPFLACYYMLALGVLTLPKHQR